MPAPGEFGQPPSRGNARPGPDSYYWFLTLIKYAGRGLGNLFGRQVMSHITVFRAIFEGGVIVVSSLRALRIDAAWAAAQDKSQATPEPQKPIARLDNPDSHLGEVSIDRH